MFRRKRYTLSVTTLVVLTGCGAAANQPIIPTTTTTSVPTSTLPQVVRVECRDGGFVFETGPVEARDLEGKCL